MKSQWRPQDFLDLEYFYQKTAATPGEGLDGSFSRNQRRLFLDHIEPDLPENQADAGLSKQILRLWLKHQRKVAKQEDPEVVLPGESYAAACGLAIFSVILMGFTMGAGTALSFLWYEGRSPVNVSAFFGLFIITQVLLILLVMLLAVFKKRFPAFYRLSPLYHVIARVLSFGIRQAARKAIEALPGSKRAGYSAAIGRIKSGHRLYGPVFYWPLFILLQTFAVCFNTGVIAALLMKVSTTDIAFGWQSTLQVGAQAVYRIVAALSQPWSLLVPKDLAHPTLAQIESSRIILKDGMAHLSNAGLASWWPFLCFSVLCYGLLPRIFLLTSGFFASRKSLKSVNLLTPQADKLLRVMTTPSLRTRGTDPVRQPLGESHADSGNRAAASDKPILQKKIDRLTVLIPADLNESCPEDRLSQIIQKRTGRLPAKKIVFGNAFPEGLEKSHDHTTGILVLQEAWLPPIRESMHFLAGLRQKCGPDRIIQIGLIGKPRPDTIFTPPAEPDIRIWKQAIHALGDPAIVIENLGETTDEG